MATCAVVLLERPIKGPIWTPGLFAFARDGPVEEGGKHIKIEGGIKFQAAGVGALIEYQERGVAAAAEPPKNRILVPETQTC